MSFRRLHWVVTVVLVAGVGLSCATTKGRTAATDCTAERGWAHCPAIKARLEPVAFGGRTVQAKTPTALVFAKLDAAGPLHLVVADKSGEVVAYDTTSDRSRTLLQLDGVASTNPERGLMGFALHPEFTEAAGARRFFTYHTLPRTDEASANCRPLPPAASPERLAELCAIGEKYGCGGSSVVTEWTVTDLEGPVASTTSRVLLERNQPGDGHNAGHVLFGPDGKLYVSLGDGGAQQDPCGRGQDTKTATSAILRLDVDGDQLIPEDNPFVGMADHEPLIWAYGFRNPWRMDFIPSGQPREGTLLVGDTGQARIEEIDVVVRGGNYGWSVREGTLDHSTAPASASPLLGPLYEYGNPAAPLGDAGGYAVVGGVVHAGDDFPALTGKYIFGDNVTMKLFALDLAASDLEDSASWNGRAKVQPLSGVGLPAATFARGPDGEVYVGGSDGRIRKIVPAE